MKQLLGLLKSRSEVIFISLAVALFAAGLASLLLRRGDDVTNGDGGGSSRAAIGPSPGESIPTYIESRKAELVQRAQKEPKKTSFAVISFGAYLKPSQIDAILATQKLPASEAQWRLPLPGDPPQAVAVETSVAEAIAKAVAAATDELAARAQDLDNYAKEAALAEERAQFGQDAKAARQLVDALRSDPAIVHAVVVRGSNAALMEISKLGEVRLVDLGAAGTTPKSRTFLGIRPEQTDVA